MSVRFHFWITIFSLVILGREEALSFPEMVRHGYVNCTACHVSPSGGGVLSPYGRELSRELLSTWGREKESKFLYGIGGSKTDKETFRGGGDLRAVQVHRENSKVRRGDTIPMQADVELGVDDGTFAAVLSVGLRNEDRSTKDLNQLFSRRHYFLYRISDEKSLRVGKFLKSYGLNIADHIVSVRRDLRWDQGTESYNLEFAHLGERLSAYVTLVSDDPQERGIGQEYGVATSGSWFFWDTSKIGLSYFYGRNQEASRDVFGPFWILSFTPRLFWMLEFDWQLRNPGVGTRTSGYAGFSRLNFEAIKGVIPFVQVDQSHLDLDTRTSLRESYGVGLQWFPRPHWEFVGSLNKEHQGGADEITDFYWLMAHFYL